MSDSDLEQPDRNPDTEFETDAEPDSATDLMNALDVGEADAEMEHPPLIRAEGIPPTDVPETALLALKAADADAESDLARPSRVNQYRAERRTRISMALPGVLMFALGIFYLYEASLPTGQALSGMGQLGIGVAALGLGMVGRFFVNGRRERGLFIVGLVILAWVSLAALVIVGSLLIEQAWPMGIIGIGLAMMLTFLFERSHDRGLIFPALGILAIGLVAAPLALSPSQPNLGSLFATFWPLLLLVGALALLPRAVRPRPE